MSAGSWHLRGKPPLESCGKSEVSHGRARLQVCREVEGGEPEGITRKILKGSRWGKEKTHSRMRMRGKKSTAHFNSGPFDVVHGHTCCTRDIKLAQSFPKTCCCSREPAFVWDSTFLLLVNAPNRMCHVGIMIFYNPCLLSLWWEQAWGTDAPQATPGPSLGVLPLGAERWSLCFQRQSWRCVPESGWQHVFWLRKEAGRGG